MPIGRRKHGFRLSWHLSCGLVVLGTDEEGPKRTLKGALIQKQLVKEVVAVIKKRHR